MEEKANNHYLNRMARDLYSDSHFRCFGQKERESCSKLHRVIRPHCIS
jgi:hypothetical protein